jgi:CDP-paratose 2-epimerase
MIALVTGAGGLIGTEACEQFVQAGYDVVGIDCDLRSYFFGPEASTQHNITRLSRSLGDSFQHVSMDIRDTDAIDGLFHITKPDVVIHTAAQPSHDWAAREPLTDFDVNARATLGLLQATRVHCPDSPFVLCSTSKVYGARPNTLPLRCHEKRYDLPKTHRYYSGIDTSMSVDLTTHSLFGVSKLAGDLACQEYGRYFDIPTVCFRPGCLTGGNHSGAKLHGFLSFLVKCCITGEPYTIIGYRGFQVRCNIHSSDLVRAFLAFVDRPSAGAVYNIGGGRENSISVLEAIDLAEAVTGKRLTYDFDDTPRIGDHKHWISSNAAFQTDYPSWSQSWTLEGMVRDIADQNAERWTA